MSYTSDIRRIAKQDEPKKGLSIIQERAVIPSGIGKPVDTRTESIVSPLTFEALTTETVRVYQNNDDTSDNWVDVERVLTAQFVDYNGKIFTVSSFTWPE